MVRRSFHSSLLLKGLNSTLISLIPKNDNPMSMTNLRAISLGNTLYKVIYKIIVKRLRLLLHELISLPKLVLFRVGKSQTTF